MRTIIIATDTLIDDINNNPTFFGSFLSSNDVLFCHWYPDQASVANAVPDLKNLVGDCRDWRAVIVCDESTINPAKRNPFDTVEYRDKERKDNVSGLEFIKQRQENRIKVFKDAAGKPLTKLVTLLCDSPEIGDGILWSPIVDEEEENSTNGKEITEASGTVSDPENNESEPEAEETVHGESENDRAVSADAEDHAPAERNSREKIIADHSMEYAELEEYRQEAREKQELRQEILRDVSEHFVKPGQVICIAMRDYQDDQDFLHTTWIPHTELQYSSFYNFNLYFDKMRYLIFDISDRNTENERLSSLKFEYALMLISCNPLPANCLQPNRVYLMECLYDTKALENLLTEYYEKLTGTALKIEKEMQTLYNTSSKELSDHDAENLFHSHVTVPVSAPSGFDTDSLYTDYHGLGLAGDCPTDENAKWESEKADTTNALMRYLKQPRRAIKKAAREMRGLSDCSLEESIKLSDFQMDDLNEVMENQEIEMVSSSIPNVFDTEEYRKRLDAASDEVEEKEKTRMSRSCTIGIGACALILFLIGLLPMWLGSLSDPLVIPGALIMMAVALVVLAVSGFVCLFFLRHSLVKKWKDYNNIMREIVSDINSALSQASEYISLVCRFMQEHAVLMWAKYHELPQKSKCYVLEKHLTDIYNQREYVCDVFGDMVHTCAPDENTQTYDYDFLRTCTYKYPLPVAADQKILVKFMETGSTVEVPYRFMESLTVRRVELYD